MSITAEKIQNNGSTNLDIATTGNAKNINITTQDGAISIISTDAVAVADITITSAALLKLQGSDGIQLNSAMTPGNGCTLKIPMTEIYFNGLNSTATTVSVADTWYKVAGTTTIGNNYILTMPFNNRITYPQFLNARWFNVFVSFSFEVVGASQVCQFGINKVQANGGADTIMPQSVVQITASSGNTYNGYCQGYVSISETGYVEFWCKNVTANNNITVKTLNMLCYAM